MLLPKKFLDWAYSDRVRVLRNLLGGELTRDPIIASRFLLDSMRHNPIFCTASTDQKGHITVNGKVVGAGFVLKKDFLEEALKKLEAHVDSFSNLSIGEYMRNGGQVLLELLYFEDREEAYRKVDFSKIATLELAEGMAGFAQHTWHNLQRYTGEACFIYYMPPTLSFEVRGEVELHREGSYHQFVNLVHDCVHKFRPSRTNKPAVILNVKEVYNNSASLEGFGTKMI